MRLRSTALAPKRVERRLAAILAADVAGYSRLMNTDEEGTHARLRARLRQLVEPKIKENGGRTVKNTGDGMLAEFPSVVDAVRCAAEIQHGMIDRNAEVSEDKRISFRIGVNVGDVIVEPEDIFGDGVNIAARLEALAEPNGICISSTVRDHIGERLPYLFEDIGEQNVKNIPNPVHVYRIRLDSEAKAPETRTPQAMPKSARRPPDEVFVFGPFRLIPAQRLLVLDEGEPLHLGSRALDILIALVERAGETIHKDQLIARAWPDTVVDEGALRVHVAALRRALGDGRAGKRYIVNNPGRGYTFVAPVMREIGHPAPAAAAGTAAAGNLPVALTRIVGRDDLVAALATQLKQRRLTSIVGPGGIGKTTVAVAVAEAVRPSYADGAWFVGLASLPDPELVPSAIGTVLGISLSGANPISALAAWLRDKQMLIVLDNCEHVIGAVAPLAEALLKAASQIRILVTSREPLRAEGERLHRLASLKLPPDSVDLSAAEALQYSAVQLFNERAMAALDGFSVEDANVAAVLEICRRLDGVPLALELAAARIDVFGVRELAAHLGDRFRVLTSGRRTALPRHQTLGATLDWSYQLLSEAERSVLRRLAVFAGDFLLDAVAAVAADIAPSEVVDHIGNLVAKSLVVADLRSEFPRYRLLDTTRLYGRDKLQSSGELQQVARRHAEYYCALFAPADTESESRPQTEWLAIYGPHLDDVRAGLDWAFSPEGDPKIGVGLTVAVVPLWVQLSLLGECRERVERALAVLDSDEAATARPRMQLSWALGWSLMYGVGRAREAGPAWTTTLELAEKLDDTVYRLRALWSSCIDQFNNGDLRAALEFARRFAGLASDSGDAVDLMMADRLLATAHHYFGDQGAARHHIDRALTQLDALAQQPQIVRVRFDMRVSTHYFQARILWLQGFAEQALRVVEYNIEEGKLGQALSFCSVLGQGACPIAFWAGDLDAAERYGAMLLDHTEHHPIRLWNIWARCFIGLVVAKRGDIDAGLRALRGGLEQAGEARFLPRFLLLLGEMAACLGKAGEVGVGLQTVEETLARCEARDELWYAAELLRIKGELVIMKGASAAAAAEGHFLSALDWAGRQQALSWELRTATSLARLWRDQHRVADAREKLRPVYDRFTEGFATADLQTAKSLLEQLV
jgi:predicted ATPase/class 3 adenylate cyclase/DNA-binding winged helix-turn-helix (wHTH) protein